MCQLGASINPWAANNRTAFAKAQMSEPRSSTISAVVERPGHQCGEDLVNYVGGIQN